LGIAGIAVSELLGDVEGLLVGAAGILAVAGGKRHVADPVMGDPEVALRLGIAGIAVGELLGDVEGLLVGAAGILAVAGRKRHVAP